MRARAVAAIFFRKGRARARAVRACDVFGNTRQNRRRQCCRRSTLHIHRLNNTAELENIGMNLFRSSSRPRDRHIRCRFWRTHGGEMPQVAAAPCETARGALERERERSDARQLCAAWEKRSLSHAAAVHIHLSTCTQAYVV